MVVADQIARNNRIDATSECFLFAADDALKPILYNVCVGGCNVCVIADR